MKRKKLAAKILAVIMSVSACISVNDSALIAMAAETAASETVSAEAKEDSAASHDGQTTDETVTADDQTAEETATVDDGQTEGQTAEETVTADDGQTAEETVASDDKQSTEESTGETAEEAEAVDENQASDEDPNTSDEEAAEESAEEAATTDAEKADAEKAAEEEELPEMMEIIDSEGVKADGGRKMAGNWPASADDVLNAEVIDADVDTASSGCVLAGVAGKYITDSSAALARINEIRLEACKEGVRNPDTGQPLTEADYVPIKWSGDLEYIARIRAAESAFTIGHARLNGQNIWGVTSPSGVRSWGEVLAWNWSESVISGINQWYGEKADWVNQTQGAVTGHYTQMIDPTNRYVGLGTFCSNDARYYNTTAGEFSDDSGLSETPMGMSGNCVQLLDVALDKVSGGEIMGTLHGAKGSTGRLLLAGTMSAKTTSPIYFLNGVDWTSSNTSVVTVAADGTTTAVGSGTATIQASAAGGAVTASAEFSVKSIEDCDITLAQTSYTYDGSEKKPAVTASYHGTTLKAGTDYTVSYDNNVNAGTATVTITGSEEYAGTVEKTFTIEKATQSPRAEDVSVEFGADAQIDITGAQGNLTYKSQNTAIATVLANGTVNGVKAGTTTIEVTADGGANYKPATVTINCVVIPVSLSDARIAISLSETEFTYNASEQKPVVKVLCDGADLTEGADYELIWGESTNAGQKSVRISGLGNYQGRVTKTYTIKKAGQTIGAQDVSVEFGGSAEAVITGARGDVHFVSRNTSVAKVSEDGRVTGAGAGTTTIDVTADGNENYAEGTTSFEVTVTAVDISDSARAAVSLSAESFVFNGREQKPVVTVVCDDKELVDGTDYEVLFGDGKSSGDHAASDDGVKADSNAGDCTNAGEKTILVNGIGNYKGSVSKHYTILKAAQTLSAADVVVPLQGTADLTVDGAHTALTFESLDTSVATVDLEGVVTGVRTGETAVRVLAEESENYEAAEVQVNVKVLKAAQNLQGSASDLTINAGKGGVFTVTGAVGEVSAVVGNTGIAKVTSVTAVEGEEGTYKIAISGIKGGTTELTVTAAGDSDHEAGVVNCSCKIRPKATTSFKAAAAANGKGIKLTWAKVAGATNYEIYRNGSKKPIKTVGNVSAWTDAGANTNGTKYTFKIYAKSGNLVSAQPKTVVYYKLNRPAITKLTNSASRKMTVKWAKNAKATSYQIQYSLKSNFSGAKSANVPKNSIVSKTIGNLTKGKTYYVRIRSCKKVSGKMYYSAWSASKKVKISK